MGDMGDTFREYTKFRRERRRNNLVRNTNKLTQLGIPFTSKNHGIHLVIQYADKTIDFYPSTGLWWGRTNRKQRRGIRPLLQYLSDVTLKEEKR